MLKKDIEILQSKAISFLRRADSIAKDMEITLVSLVEGEMIFVDNESGVQVKCQLEDERKKAKLDAISVGSKAVIGEPTIKITPSKTPAKKMH